MIRKWVIKEQGNPEVIDSLSEELNIDLNLSNLLVQRGIRDFDNAKKYFRPDFELLYDPFLFKDMHKAIDRISTAMRTGEKILVYGDYDVDGTTSVALVYSFLKTQYNNLDFYIPDRYDEGYGISIKGIDYAKNQNFSLIIALDCGTKAVDKIEYASQRGIDFIICDHHKPGDELPKAIALLNPKLKGSSYPFDQLSGCGVGFKLIQAYARMNNIQDSEIIPYLDLVAVSIASDIVPIVDENRILACKGLEQLNSNPQKGLHAIIKVAGINNQKLTIDDIVFKIGPRINAAGRVEEGKNAVKLLVEGNEKIAKSLSDKLDAFNGERRKMDSATTQKAMQMVSIENELMERKSTVVYSPEWHKGVVGIVASRLIETYYRPTVVLTKSNNLITGSARSVPGFDLYKAIDYCSDLLESFGGHMYAAGLSMLEENYMAFSDRFEEYVANNITEDQTVPIVEIDAPLRFADITPKFLRVLKQFRPFGPENLSPIFIARQVYDAGSSKVVGSNREHLKLHLKQDGVEFAGIGFNLAHHLDLIMRANPFDICFTIEENSFRGRVTTQLNIKDIRQHVS